MTSSSTYTFFQSAVEVPHCSLQHLSWDTTNFFLDSLFQFIQCPWLSRLDPILKVTPQEKITDGQIPWSWGPGNVTESWDDTVTEQFFAQLPLIALQCTMSHHPVETRLPLRISKVPVFLCHLVYVSSAVKVKFFPWPVIRTQLYSSSSSVLDWRGWSTPRLGRFTLGNEPRCPLYRGLGGS